MGLEENVAEIQNKDNACKMWTLCRHAFYDLTHVSPVVFVFLLKECYYYGTCKATAKFRALQYQINLVLHNDPKPGPATFVVQCMYVSPLFEDHSQGFTHLIISSLRRFLKTSATSEDSLEMKDSAAYLLVDIIRGQIYHDEKIVIKVLEIFYVKLTNIEKAMCHIRGKDDLSCATAKELVEQYVVELLESQLYMTAVTLIEQFSISHFGQSFLLEMMQNNQFKAAEKWAAFMGKPMLSILIEEFTKRNMLKDAHEIIKKNNLKEDFPDVYKKCKESSLKNLAEKGCWDVAEARINNDKQLMQYLVYLAMEAGYMEKVDELCGRYSLDKFLDIKDDKQNKVLCPVVPETSNLEGRYLHLEELLVEDIIWVDEVEGLLDAICHIEGFKVVGLDCEWKPNYVKGSNLNKVSIIQIASEKVAFIFDLIKLHEEVPKVLDDSLTRIMMSPRILKLGYNFQCDMKQLAHSYEGLKCFKNYEMLLDIQNIFKELHGGLAGLTKKVLGASLNKTRRNSNWEQRPLTPNQFWVNMDKIKMSQKLPALLILVKLQEVNTSMQQCIMGQSGNSLPDDGLNALEYAALDAVVLVHIFHHLPGLGHDKSQWKSCIESFHTENAKKFKKDTGTETNKQGS